jgi:hypothetical protein
VNHAAQRAYLSILSGPLQPYLICIRDRDQGGPLISTVHLLPVPFLPSNRPLYGPRARSHLHSSEKHFVLPLQPPLVCNCSVYWAVVFQLPQVCTLIFIRMYLQVVTCTPFLSLRDYSISITFLNFRDTGHTIRDIQLMFKFIRNWIIYECSRQ